MEGVRDIPLFHCFFFFFFIFFFFIVVATSGERVSAPSLSFDYKDAVSKSLLYFEAQRSGHLPYNQRAIWRGQSGLTDGLEQGVDLVGGYHDAGDHVKFGLPMAFTITMLSWGVIEYGDHLVAAGEYEHALEAIKWGTDYFIKAHPSPHVLWAEVGDGETDHYCWQRPEDMTTPRRAYKIDAQNPGSEIAGETAAAMAAAAIVFNQTDPHYSQLLIQHAQQLFEFGDKYRGRYDLSIGVVKGYYPSMSGYGDELLWAALWLHRATARHEYLEYVADNAYKLGGAGWAVAEFSWDIKYAGVQVLAAKLLTEEGELRPDSKHTNILKKYKSKAEHYLCSCLNKNSNTANVRRTPGGLLFVRKWNPMQHVAAAAFLLTAYSDELRGWNQSLHCPKGVATPDDLLALAKSQADYILGSNPRNLSYLVGFGPEYPKRVHHRAASMVSYKENREFIGCMQGYNGWYGRQKENPNVVVGAIVGGPGAGDEFEDRRGNYMQTEPCTYNTAPMVGVFARLMMHDEGLEH